MVSWLRPSRTLAALLLPAGLSLLTGLASPSPAEARWPAGVLNYCGFDGFWDEAGWRDLRWAEGGTAGVRFDRDVKRFGKASLRIGGPGRDPGCAATQRQRCATWQAICLAHLGQDPGHGR